MLAGATCDRCAKKKTELAPNVAIAKDSELYIKLKFTSSILSPNYPQKKTRHYWRVFLITLFKN